jgi:uncharacterized protein (DUF1330 family)
MPKGYFFVELEVTDPAAYEAYRAAVPDIISAHGGRILVRGGDPQPLDGAVPQRHRVIVEFDDWPHEYRRTEEFRRRLVEVPTARLGRGRELA